MSKIIRNVKRKIARKEGGQVLVLVALAAVGIIAILGLVMDVGIMFIGNARLRRAVDAAALSAALQYRKGATTAEMTRAANEFLWLNGITSPNSTISNCANTPGDPTLCTTPFPRKLVRVRTTAQVKLAFLPVIGIRTATISAVATSETASLDVVLVIDRSESMTYEAEEGVDMRDPFYCNGISTTDSHGNVHTSSCEPFNSVVTAAIDFTDILFFPYDHVAVVTFDQEPRVELSLAAGNSSNAVINTLKDLTVFEGEESSGTDYGETAIYPNGSPSRCYGQGNVCPICGATPKWPSGSTNYIGLLGQGQDPCRPGYVNPPNPSHYTTTNIGGGLQLAGNELSNINESRQEALWVVILLTDGVANAGHSSSGLTYYCPASTWNNKPRCNDLNVAADTDRTLRPADTSALYDASDFAYDMADFVSLPYPDGQNALLYTIGLGPEVTNYSNLGKTFLDYAATVGRGQSFYTSDPADLKKIFLMIGTNIATRLSQ